MSVVRLTTNHKNFKILEEGFELIAIKVNKYTNGSEYPFLIEYKTDAGTFGEEQATKDGKTKLFTIINK